MEADSKMICCLCCASGPISFALNIDRKGYVPGEKIVINAECCNKSRRKIKDTKVSIEQVIYLAKFMKNIQFYSINLKIKKIF